MITAAIARRYLAAALLTASGSALLAVPARPAGLDVRPSLLEFQVTPGQSLERSVTLTNPGTDPVEITTATADWTMSESGEIRFRDPSTTPRSCAAWIRVTPAAIRVPGRGEARVIVRIDAPAEVEGTRWAVVFFRLPDAPGFLDGGPADLSARIGLTVYVTGAGTAREGMAFSDLRSTVDPDLRLLAVFENSGNTSVRMKVTWQIRADSGAVVRTDVTTVVALPESRREASVPLARLPAGKYRATVMSRWGDRRWKVRECGFEVPIRSVARSRLIS